MKNILSWIQSKYDKAGIKGLQLETIAVAMNTALLEAKSEKAIKVSKNITIKCFSDRVVVIISKLQAVKSFKGVMPLKSGNYYWVRYRLNDPEVMQVRTAENYVDLYFSPIGSEDRFKITNSDICVLQEVEGWEKEDINMSQKIIVEHSTNWDHGVIVREKAELDLKSGVIADLPSSTIINGLEEWNSEVITFEGKDCKVLMTENDDSRIISMEDLAEINHIVCKD